MTDVNGQMIPAEEYDSAARKPRPLEELDDILNSGPLIHALVSRDLKIRYKRSVFGVLWTLVNPLAMLVVLSLAFTKVLRADAPDYPFFVIPGLLLWNFVSQVTMTVVREISMGVDMWRRVRVPKSALIVATTLTGLLNILFALVPVLAVIVVTGRPLGLGILTLPVTLLLTAVFVLGISLVLAAIAVYFPDIADIYSILLPALMFTAPIAYPISVAMPPLSDFVRFNPLTLYVEAFRAPLYGARTPSIEDFAAISATALGTLLVGWLLFTRSADDVPYQS